MSDVTQSELLINALLDGRLDAAEAERAAKQIADDEQLSEMLAEFTRQRAAIVELPKYELKDRFADRVLEIAAAEEAARPMLNRPPSSSIDWKRYAMSLAAIAGLLMGMLVYQWTPLSKQDGPTVAVLSSQGKPLSAKDQAALQVTEGTLHENESSESAFADAAGGGLGGSAERLSEDSALAVVSPPPSPAPVAIDAIAAAPMRSRTGISSPTSRGIAGGAAAAPLPAPSAIALSGTPMAAPKNQSPPAIDQVWLLEVDDRFSQGQLLKAFTSNSISVPPELQQSPRLTTDANEKARTNDVDGIHVAAKPLQMKNALFQLSQSDAVTISAFHLPSEPAQPEEADESLMAEKESDAPLSIQPPQQAIAQKLRGNYFAQQAPRPSSMVPESFDKLEMKMGIAPPGAETAVEEEATDQAKHDDESIADAPAEPTSEMEELFPGSMLESDRLQNFLILIRNEAPAKK